MATSPASGPGSAVQTTPTLAQVLAQGADAGGVSVTTLGAGAAAGSAATVAQVGGVGWTAVTKAADESVASSTTLQADDELFFTPVNGGVYEIQLVPIYASPAGAGTPDLKWGFYADATIRGSYFYHDISSGEAVGLTSNNMSSGAPANPSGTAATNRALLMWGWLLGAGAAFTFMWSQNTSNANATIVRAGSVLRYRRLL